MDIPLTLRGFISFVDRALNPRTATRNAEHAAAELAEHRRQLDDVERALDEMGASTTSRRPRT